MPGSILGNRVVRKEDPRFLTVGGRYLDDCRDIPELHGAAFVAFARSEIAHGTILSIETAEAAAMPGVLAVFTAVDLGLQPIAAHYNPDVTVGLLAIDRVRYVGEPVAVVVAESAVEAADAVASVFVDVEPRPVVLDVDDALTTETVLYPDAGGNAVYDTNALGLPDLTGDEFFADCEVTTSGRFVNQRVAPCPLEVRSSAAVWLGDRLFQWVSTQHAQGVRTQLAKDNGVAAAAVRVLTPDVGGGFGAKIGVYAEERLLGRLAKEVGRPVRWLETRSESMVAMGHGRAQVQYVTIGGRRNGTVTHYRLRVLQDSGASAETGTVLASSFTRPMASGVYAIPNIECRTTSVVTNTTPTVAYRGAGRPEATAAIERAMDLYAAELGMDPAELRRINLIAPFTEPHTTAVGQTYDVGDYTTALDKVMAAAGYAELRAEQARRREAGNRLALGIGVSIYVEITGGEKPYGDAAAIEARDDGRTVIYTGTSPHGQGHDTSWSMLAHARTGIPMENMDLVWGDTDLVPSGGGTMASRSLQHGGAAVDKAAGELVALATELAARALEADAADVVLDLAAGRFHVAGTPAVSRSWAELAQLAAADGERLAVETEFRTIGPTFPFGAHIAVVEVDTETGAARLVRHIACDDAGTRVNPLIVEGQIHGGVAQGAAQAMFEEVRYDESGNPITANFADYGIVTAVELPMIEIVSMETPTPRNPLGAKGIGESGTIGSTPAVHSAVIDAVAHFGVRHIDMPTTAEKVWRAITGGDRSGAARNSTAAADSTETTQ